MNQFGASVSRSFPSNRPFRTLLPDDHFHDECGVFGICDREEAAKLTYLGLYALQHRGQESAGIATVTEDGRVESHKSMGLVQEIFTPDVLSTLPGRIAIGHTRYSTAGDTSLANAQPVVIDCNKGKLALAHNGNLTNATRTSPPPRARRLDLRRAPATPKSSSTSSPAAAPAISPRPSPTLSVKSKAPTRFSSSRAAKSTPFATRAASAL